jgi:hypothetical protein
MDINQLIKAWNLSSKLHTFHAPASEQELQMTEKELGCYLPSSLRELYLLSNGLNLLHGNLNIYPLREDNDFALTTASRKLKEYHPQLPSAVIVFGNDGSDELFGLWLPRTEGKVAKHPVLGIGEFDPKNMAIMATDILPFLYGWTAYYLMLYKADNAVLDAIGLPQALRYKDYELDDETFAQLRKWADPMLPDPHPDPYRHSCNVEDLTRLFGA